MNRIKFFIFNMVLSFKTLSTYRAATILKFFVNFFLTLISLFLWKAIYNNDDVISGYTLEETFQYIILLRMCQCVYPFGTAKSYAELIKTGQVTQYLLKPLSLEIQIVSSVIGKSVYNFCFCSIPSIILMLLFVDKWSINIFRLPLFFIWFIGAYVFVFLFEISIGVICYYVKNLWGIDAFKNTIQTLFSGELLPLQFYPHWLLNILDILPFASIYYVPIALLLGKTMDNIWMYIFILLFSNLFFLLIYTGLSKKMIKHITIQGG